MSERLPYEEQLPQQLRDFPLPDEDAAWADMKRRLEEDDDDGIIVWWRKGCAGWGLLLLALIVTGWWLFTKDGSSHKKEDSSGNKIRSVIRDTTRSNSLTNTTDTELLTGKDSSASHKSNSSGSDAKYDEPSAVPSITDTVNSTGRSAGGGVIHKPGKRKQQRRSGSDVSRDNRIQQNNNRVKATAPPAVTITPSAAGSKTEQSSSQDSAIINRANIFIAGDSSKNKQQDSIQKTPEAVPADSTKKKGKRKPGAYFFSAGLGLNQQLPIAGQKAVPYSSQGRTFSLADYIPSVYARFNKKDKWFIQGEFRYGAPQYNKPVTYFQQSDTIPNGDSMITERRLQKTYYHQLPFSFNFYINPQWAIGAGFVWNKFRKSVFEETLRTPQIDTLLRKETFVGKDPAAEGLSKSYFQALFESQYQWRKFSFGARYTFGLSPYLRFTLPGEPEKKETNRSLQLFIRYQLFTKNIGK